MTATAFAPSPARTILLWDTAGLPEQTRLATVLPLRWPDHPAGATLDYALDVTAALAGGDAIAMIDVAAAGFTEISQTWAAGVVTAVLAGGTAGTDDQVQVTINTASARTIFRTVRIRVI